MYVVLVIELDMYSGNRPQTYTVYSTQVESIGR